MAALRKAWLVVVLVGGAVLFSPCLRTPYLLDDYMHAAMVEGRLGITRGPFGLYDFVNDADRATLQHRGVLPWWADPQLKIRFFRPLPSALFACNSRSCSCYEYLRYIGHIPDSCRA